MRPVPSMFTDQTSEPNPVPAIVSDTMKKRRFPSGWRTGVEGMLPFGSFTMWPSTFPSAPRPSRPARDAMAKVAFGPTPTTSGMRFPDGPAVKGLL
ncbi:MAG: hypothetical protein E6J27_14560 [Chloroflexi bacterium]|nr:MAG: hypothetical protein E6J27_14560 [Chloroflexota bacterium]